MEQRPYGSPATQNFTAWANHLRHAHAAARTSSSRPCPCAPRPSGLLPPRSRASGVRHAPSPVIRPTPPPLLLLLLLLLACCWWLLRDPQSWPRPAPPAPSWRLRGRGPRRRCRSSGPSCRAPRLPPCGRPACPTSCGRLQKGGGNVTASWAERVGRGPDERGPCGRRVPFFGMALLPPGLSERCKLSRETGSCVFAGCGISAEAGLGARREQASAGLRLRQEQVVRRGQRHVGVADGSVVAYGGPRRCAARAAHRRKKLIGQPGRRRDDETSKKSRSALS